MVVTDTALDGRRVRRETNREAVLGALEDLWREGRFDATASDVAEKAGLSSRSLFRYFDDADDLIRAAIERVLARVEHLAVVHAHPSEDTRTKMEALFAARDALFSVAAPAAHAGRVAQFRSPVIAARIATTRRTLRAQVADLFATELTLAPAGALDILDDATSFEAWELRSTRSTRARNTAQRLLLTTLVSLLTKEST